MSDDEHGFSLALAFDTDDPEFCRGVEIGSLWERFKHPEAFEATIRAVNAEMVIRIGESTGRKFTAEESGDPDWMFLVVEEADSDE